MKLVLTPHAAILCQAQHGHHVFAFDRRLFAGVDDENLERMLLLEHQIGDHRRQYGPTLGQDPDLNCGVRGRAAHPAAASSNSVSRRGRSARSAASDSALMRTLSRM